MTFRHLRLTIASALALATLGGVTARAGDEAIGTDSARVATLLKLNDQIKTDLKPQLAGAIVRENVEPAILLIERFVSNYARMVMVDSSVVNQGVLESYLATKLWPELEALGLSRQYSWLHEAIADLTKNQIEVVQLRESMGVHESSETSDINDNGRNR